MERLAVLIKTSRPIGWVIAPLVFSIGLLYSAGGLSPLALLQIFLLSFPHSMLLYGINDIYDYDSDKVNPRKRSPLDPKYHLLIEKISIAVMILLLSSSLLTLNLSNIFSMCLLLFFSYYYSAPPLRIKERPPLDSFSNGAIFFIVFAIGYSYSKPISEIPWKIYFVALCVMGIHSFSTIMDYSADMKAGHRTFATVFGKRAAALFALILFILTLFYSRIGTVVINYYVVFCSILFLIAFIYPSERLAYFIFKLICAGFVITGSVFLITYTHP